MGQRITFYRNNYGRTLKELLFDNYSVFRSWYLQQDRASMEEYNEHIGSEEVSMYLEKEADLAASFQSLDKKLIDQLTEEFIFIYCDWTSGENDIIKSLDPCMSKWRYGASNQLVASTGNTEFIRLWGYLVNGRSVKDLGHFESYTNDGKIGFLSKEEVHALKGHIEQGFGTLEMMMKKNWPENPATEGLEYVLQAIGEMNKENKELITAIE